MDKRVAIFAPDQKDRNDLRGLIEDYFNDNFGMYKDIKFQEFDALHTPSESEQVGHRYEILIVFDRRLCPTKNRFERNKNTPYIRALKIVFDMTKGLCDSSNIPYVIYEGEIVKKQELKLIMKLDRNKDKITTRLEEKLTQESLSDGF